LTRSSKFPAGAFSYAVGLRVTANVIPSSSCMIRWVPLSSGAISRMRWQQRSQRPSVDFISEEAVTFFPPIRRALGTLAGIRSAKAQFCVRDQFEKLARWHGDNPRWVLDVWTEVWLSPEFSSWDIDRCLLEVTCPVLAIHGDSDEFGSVEFPRRITSKVKGLGELAILAHCGHVPHRERKAEVLRLTASFLDQRATGSR
jgi:pimeloyl-ACP methyl ester carboxylesterase